MQVASVEARVWVGGQGCGLALGVLQECTGHRAAGHGFGWSAWLSGPGVPVHYHRLHTASRVPPEQLK